MSMRLYGLWSAFFLTILLSLHTNAQLADSEEKGSPTDGVFQSGDVDTVNIQNGNLHISIPILVSKQRGGRLLKWSLEYNTQSWSMVYQPNNCGLAHCPPGFYLVNDNSEDTWKLADPYHWDIDNAITDAVCDVATPSQNYQQYTNFVLIEPDGTRHPLALRQEVGILSDPGNLSSPPGTCHGQTLFSPTLDGSGYTYDLNAGEIRDKAGNLVGSTYKDTNGNIASYLGDSLGRNPVTLTAGANITYVTPLGNSAFGPSYTIWTTKDANGNDQQYKLTYQAIDLTPHICEYDPFGLGHPISSGQTCTDGTWGKVVPHTLLLPNGRSYTFTYNNNTAGELAQINLPSGAHINYTYDEHYDSSPVTHGNLHQNWTGGARVTSKTITVGADSYQWAYQHDMTTSSVTVIDPQQNRQVHQFSTVTNYAIGGYQSTPNSYETEVDYYDNASTPNLLRTVKTDYTADLDPSYSYLINVRPIRVTTILENGLQSKKETDYETFSYTCPNCSVPALATRMNPTEVREYGFGSGVPGTLMRRTDYTYLHTGNSTYQALNIVNRVTSVTTYDGNGSQVSKTVNEYDNYSHPSQSMQSSAAIQHDSAFGTGYTTRGNLTAVSKWRNTDNTYVASTNQYDDAGNLLSTIDPGGHATYYDYTDSWANSTCSVGGTTKAYPTKITNAKGQFASTTYSPCNGMPVSSTDINSNTTSTTYGLLNRPVHLSLPDGGAKDFCYSDDQAGSCYNTGNEYVIETDALSSGVNLVTKTITDELGRTHYSQVTSDPEGTVTVETDYDGLGRAYKVSNPYRGTPQYWATNSYDGLGRLLATQKQDSSQASISYSANTSTSTDEAGNQRTSVTDALGRLVKVSEDPSGLNYETDYQYDTLGNMLRVDQKGGSTNSVDWRTRTFTYNSLGQLLCSANPEIGPGSTIATCPAVDTGSYITGTTRYNYNNEGEVTSKIVPLPNQTGNSTGTISYGYDVLHRVTSTTYTDGTPSVYFSYGGDTPTCTVPTVAATNLKGHMSAMCDGSGVTAWNYDTMGRTLTEAKKIGSVTDQVSYTYYYNGAQKTVTYPVSGTTPFTVTYNINAAGRIDTATGSDGVTYGHVTDTWEHGSPHHYEFGSDVALEDSYNSRLQPLETKATQVSPSNTLFDRVYDFHSSTMHNNGNLWGVTDNMDTFETNRPSGNVSYTYDTMNRVTSAYTAGTNCTAVSGGTRDWGESFTIDAWGNLTARTATKCVADPMPSSPADGRNRLTTATYDAAGNVTNNNGVGYQYNIEGEMTQASGTAYIYDGLGQRVAKPDKLYWPAGLEETTASNTQPVRYIFFGGRRVAKIDPGTAGTKFYIADNVGSTSLITDASGTVLNQSLFFPYGTEMEIKSLDTGNNYKFTGKERDAESGLDNFGARFYASTLGRFMTPDWDAKPATVPYAVFGDPQTLNLYAYVENAPVNKVDADGHQDMGAVTFFYDTSTENIFEYGMTGDELQGKASRMFGNGSYVDADDRTNTDASSAVASVTAQQQAQQAQQNSGAVGSLVNAQNAAMTNGKYQPDTPTAGTTHCSEAACAIAKGTGTNLTGILYDSKGNNYDANTQINNLANSSGYHPVTPEQAQTLANNGTLVFGTQHGARHGHIASVRPEGVPGDNPRGRSGPLLANVGLFNGVAHQSAVMTPAHGAIVYYAPNQ